AIDPPPQENAADAGQRICGLQGTPRCRADYPRAAGLGRGNAGRLAGRTRSDVPISAGRTISRRPGRVELGNWLAMSWLPASTPAPTALSRSWLAAAPKSVPYGATSMKPIVSQNAERRRN